MILIEYTFIVLDTPGTQQNFQLIHFTMTTVISLMTWTVVLTGGNFGTHGLRVTHLAILQSIYFMMTILVTGRFTIRTIECRAQDKYVI